MTFPRTLGEAANMATMHDLRFILGEIDINLLGVPIRADLFERRDGQWSWSARVVPLVPAAGARPFGDVTLVPGPEVVTGPHLVASEEEGSTAALAWIRARIGPSA